jgi:anti-sigma factor RsiW
MVHVKDRIQAFLAGELDDAAQLAATAHLAECPDCALAVSEARHLWDLLGEVGALPGPAAGSAWPAVRARTFGSKAERLLPGAGPWSRAGLAGVAMAAGLGLAILLPGADRKIEVDAVAETGVESAGEASAPGGTFWLEETSGTTFSEMWLTAAAGGSGS